MSVFVLWEDRAISPIAKFGPHAFLVACVAQQMNKDRHDLRRSEVLGGRSCAGNARLLDELQRGPLWDSGVTVVAVLDTDKLHDLLRGIRSRQTIADEEYPRWSDMVVTEVLARATNAVQSRLQICFLDRNLEALLSIIGRGEPELGAALRKNLLARDKILHRAAADEDLVRRACAEMPSWAHLVTTVARLLTAATV